MSTNEEKLTMLASIWSKGVNHPSYIDWYSNAVENYNFYAGAQWKHEDTVLMKRRGQEPLTFNMLQSILGALSGVETHSQYTVGCDVDLDDASASALGIAGNEEGNTYDNQMSYRQLSKALTHLLLTWQKNENVLSQGGWKFKDAMITGLSWSSVFLDQNGVIRYKWCNPLNVVADFNDLDPQFCNMQYVLRRWYMTPEQIISVWGNKVKDLDLKDKKFYDGSESGEVYNYNAPSDTFGYSSGTPLVKEVQYREPRKAYTGLTKAGRYFQTFDESRAEEICENKNDIEEISSHQIMRGYYIEGKLLELKPLTPDFPGQKDFSYIPFVWDKQVSAGKLISLVDALKGLQRDFNLRMSNASYYNRSTQVVIEGGLIAGHDKESMRRELENRNGIVHVPTGTKVIFNPQASLANSEIEMALKYLELMQRISGVQDELLGIQTNATSGIAQQQRQINSIRTNVFKFANYLNIMKTREARVAIDLFQNAALSNYYICCMDDGEKEGFILNMTIDDDDDVKTPVYNDISYLPITLEFKELKGITSNRDLRREEAKYIVQNPGIINFPTILEDLGFSNAERYLSDLKRMQQNQEQQQMQHAPAGTAFGGASAELSPEQQMQIQQIQQAQGAPGNLV